MPLRPAFLVKNKFQIEQFKRLAESYPEATYLLMDRKTLWSEFSPADLAESRIPVRMVNRDNAAEVVSGFDVVFFQTVFAGIEKVDAPLVSVQYGLAKERHNYGEWRALADLNLMYGKYSASQVEHFSPSVAVGNLKFLGWHRDNSAAAVAQAKHRLGLDPDKKSILYMPTYGELGTFDEIIEVLGRMAGAYEVLIKMHHNNEAEGRRWVKRARDCGVKHFFHSGDEQRRLLAAADVVVSDFSGAIFDAVYAGLPVVLFQPDIGQRIGKQKFDVTSLEFRRRDELGIVVERVEEFELAVRTALETEREVVALAQEARTELFEATTSTTLDRIHGLVDEIVESKGTQLTRQQTYVREAVRRMLAAERELESPRQPLAILRRLSRMPRIVSGRMRRRS